VLRRGWVPPDLLASLANGEYQILAEWTSNALISRAASRKTKTDTTKTTEHDLSLSLWLEAILNIRRALLSLGASNPSSSHSAHAEQLLAHTTSVIKAVNDHYDWAALQRFDRQVRTLKASFPALDIGNPDAVHRTFETIVARLPLLTSLVSPFVAPGRHPSPRIPLPIPVEQASYTFDAETGATHLPPALKHHSNVPPTRPSRTTQSIPRRCRISLSQVQRQRMSPFLLPSRSRLPLLLRRPPMHGLPFSPHLTSTFHPKTNPLAYRTIWTHGYPHSPITPTKLSSIITFKAFGTATTMATIPIQNYA